MARAGSSGILPPVGQEPPNAYSCKQGKKQSALKQKKVRKGARDLRALVGTASTGSGELLTCNCHDGGAWCRWSSHGRLSPEPQLFGSIAGRVGQCFFWRILYQQQTVEDQCSRGFSISQAASVIAESSGRHLFS
uniref:Uncharacterized protein n=1 Tax=Sphaerodactylus townsendi TaxID=933632 RepID=A0ACB8F2Y8_9SAUR